MQQHAKIKIIVIILPAAKSITGVFAFSTLFEYSLLLVFNLTVGVGVGRPN